MKAALSLLGLLLVVCLATARIPGGYYDVDVENIEVEEAADQACRVLSKEFSSKYHHILVKILKAEEQVVAGLNFKMDIIVGESTSLKSDTLYDLAYRLQDGENTYKKCNVVVYRDLKNNHKLTSSGCKLVSKKDFE